jgi:hypothetical protein
MLDNKTTKSWLSQLCVLVYMLFHGPMNEESNRLKVPNPVKKMLLIGEQLTAVIKQSRLKAAITLASIASTPV